MAKKTGPGGMDATKWADMLISPLVIDDLDSSVAAFVDIYAKNLLSISHPDTNPGDEKKVGIYKQVVGVRDNLQVDVLLQEAIGRRRRQLGKPKPKRGDVPWGGDLVKYEWNGNLFDKDALPTLVADNQRKSNKPWWSDQDVDTVRKQILSIMSTNLQAIADSRLELAVRVRRDKRGPEESSRCLQIVHGQGKLARSQYSVILLDVMHRTITEVLRRVAKAPRALDVIDRYSELVFAENQPPQIYELEPVIFNPKKESPPAGSTVITAYGMAKEARSSHPKAYLKRTAVPPTPLLDAVIGSIDLVPEIQDYGKGWHWWQPLFSNTFSHQSYAQAQAGFPLQAALPLMPYMLALIMERAPLIALDLRSDPNQPIFRVLGQVERIVGGGLP